MRGRLEGWRGHRSRRACFETAAFGGLLSMRTGIESRKRVGMAFAPA